MVYTWEWGKGTECYDSRPSKEGDRKKKAEKLQDQEGPEGIGKDYSVNRKQKTVSR